jgi:hypothetical protein
MPESQGQHAPAQAREARPELLHYRRWRGRLREAADEAGGLSWPRALLGAVPAAWPIARTALVTLFRRRLFWGMYALAMLIFLLFFFGQYLMSWAQTQVGQQDVRVGALGRANPRDLVHIVRDLLKFNGSGETYVNFIWYEGYTVMIVLALAGSVLIGNDLRLGSLPFYLSKPISRWHYLLGKALAVGVFVNLLTTLPALVLYVQFGLLEPGGAEDAEAGLIPGLPPYTASLAAAALAAALAGGLALGRRLGWTRLPLAVAALPELVPVLEWLVLESGNYFREQAHLALGILGYGLVLTVSLTLVLLATAVWLRRTVPLIMTWTALFFFCRMLAAAMVDGLHFDPRWRLIDLWNDTYLLGHVCLQMDLTKMRPAAQPAWHEAALVLGAVSLLCLSYLILRIRAVEVVR